MLISCFLYCTNIYPGTIDPKIDDKNYINFANSKEFSCIYKICGENYDEKLFCASAVAITKNWAITAAHVVKNAKISILQQGENKHLVNKIILHPKFDEENFGKFDIALCLIDDEFGLFEYPELYDKNDEVNKKCFISGYGLTGDFVTGFSFMDGKKRAGSNTIDRVEKDLLICSPSITKGTELEFLICCGDSGGGLFIGKKLAGINSCVISKDSIPDSSYGDESGHTRISIFAEWIKETIKNKKLEFKSILLR